MKPSVPDIKATSYRAPAAGIDNLYAVGIINLTIEESRRVSQFAFELMKQRSGPPFVPGSRVSVYDRIEPEPEPEIKPPGNRFAGLDFDDVKS